MIPVTDEDFLVIRAKHIRSRLFSNRNATDGKIVAVRRNLNFWARGADGEKYSLQTIHNHYGLTGGVLGYDWAATVTGADFLVDQDARAKIAKGAHKFPMAGVAGFLKQVPPKLEGVEIRFNPKTSHLFTRVDDGRAVKAADEATIFNTRVFARGRITYWSADEAPQALEGIASDAHY